ncbi:MAG: acetylornithine deacetylase [Gammaproteobacteria bacterium]|nr:acetylornithine deacetylase [Gammaproteobacteria bacterium]
MTSNTLPLSLAMIERLVAFDTTSHRSNLELINDVAGWLEARGAAVTLLYNDSGDKANLIAEFGPRDAPALLVSGHTDVVPASPADWRVTAPFTPKRHAERLYGRGTADMKGFIGVALTKLAAWQAEHSRHSVLLALSFDEEVGCLGAPLMLPFLEAHKERLRGIIVGEPTAMRIANAHKGHVGMRATIEGVGGHSGYPGRGVNAIDVGAGVVAQIRQLAREKRLMSLTDQRFDPPYSTVHVGLIEGGSALNQIPEHCRIDFEMRPLPGQPAMEILERLRKDFPCGLDRDLIGLGRRARLTLECRGQYPPLDERRQGYLSWIAELAECSVEPLALGFGCEAGLFAQLGVPTVICGPGSIHQAHQPDEFIAFDQITKCEGFFDRLLSQLSFPLPDFHRLEAP